MSSRTRKNIGVLGLGIIGRRVVDNLRERGFHVFVWNRTPRPVPNFVGSPAEVAELCDFVQIFVSDDDALLQMVQRMTANLTANHIVMAHCTVSPDTMRAAQEIVERRGAQLLDCPFTGSKMAAEKGELVYYVGGDEVALRQARPVLEASSKEIIEIGKVGDATTIKVATNMITAASVQAAAEAMALVSKSGLPVEKFVAAMRGNGSYSATLDMKLPMMMEGNFEPHFSVKHMLKDVVIATRLARGFGIEFGATDASRHGLTEEMRQGRGDADYSSLFRQYFPAGSPFGAQTNGDDDQPRLAGIEDGKTPEPEEVPVAVETKAEVPAEAKEMGEAVQAPAVVEPSAVETKIEAQKEVAGHAAVAAAAVAKNEESAPAAARVPAAEQPAPVAESKAKEEAVLTFPAPLTEDEGEQPRGLWGGFWRRHTDD
ncbi:MAG TPA: NAD(P)-binding domain-containing protein [Chthoniobacterales bacterium]